MKLWDITVPIREGMPLWPGDPGLSVRLAASIAHGDIANVTRIEMGAHTGTHMDAPRHFEPDGYGIERIPLETLVGPCRVFDFSGLDRHIDRAALERCDLRGVVRALFKTRNSQRWAADAREFDPDFVAVTNDAAQQIVVAGVKLLGVDYLSVEPFASKANPVHHTLLQAEVAILEGLNLTGVPPGDYELIALPIKLHGADGAPARVLLRSA
jgi:arylformamidase